MSPYYYTWSNQNTAVKFEFTGCDNNYLILDQKKILDLSSLSFQTSFGLKPLQIELAVKDQLEQFSVAPTKSDFILKKECAKGLLNLLGLEGKIFFTISGAESVENALKMARQIKNTPYILAKNKSYHGATLGALSVTGDWRKENHFLCDNWTIRFPEPKDDPNAEKLQELLCDLPLEKKPAALIIESVTGANGVEKPSSSWWKKVQKLSKEHDFFIILDEVVTGFYRTGNPFSFQHESLKPDFICLSKAITGGVIPFGALFTSTEVAKFYDTNVLSCGLTNYAHPLGLAGLKAVLEIIEQHSFKDQLDSLIQTFHQTLDLFNDCKSVSEIRKEGMLAYIEMNKNVSYEELIEIGIHAICKTNAIVLAPHLLFDPQLLLAGLTNLLSFLNRK